MGDGVREWPIEHLCCFSWLVRLVNVGPVVHCERPLGPESRECCLESAGHLSSFFSPVVGPPEALLDTPEEPLKQKARAVSD